jgi:hypothetical protein
MRRSVPILAAMILAAAGAGPATAMVAPPPVQAAPEIVPVEIDKEAKWWYRPGNKRYDRDHGRKYPDRYYSSYRFKGPSWSIACARKYRSFDPWSGTFLGRDGERHRCRL